MPPVKTRRVNQRKKSTISVGKVTEMSLNEVKEKLKTRGIKPPSSFSREQLMELLAENEETNSDTQSIADLVNSVKVLQKTVETQGETIQSLVREKANSTTPSTTSTANTVTLDCVSEPVVNVQPATLASPVHSNFQNNLGSNQFTRISSGMFPHIQVVTPAIRKQIIEGKYINLATLLSTQENSHDFRNVDESDGSVILLKYKNPQLQRNLNIQEFLEAFNIYKNVICETQDRRVEFDMYIQDIIDIASKYKGPVFYEYHKEFAKKVAAIKLTHGVNVDWSIRDEKLYASVTGNQQIKVCDTCGSSVHTTAACTSFNYVNRKYVAPNQTPQPRPVQYGTRDASNIDLRGRPILFYRGKEVCNNYLAGKCTRVNCSFAHINTKTIADKTANMQSSNNSATKQLESKK